MRIESWLDKGVARVIIGTAAVRDPALVKDAAKSFPGRVAVGLDARDGKVAVEGWATSSELTALDIAQRFEDAGVAAMIYTDIARDGMLRGSISMPRSRSPMPCRFRSLPQAALLRSMTCMRFLRLARTGWQVRSSAARSMTAGSMQRRHCADPRRPGRLTCSKSGSFPAST